MTYQEFTAHIPWWDITAFVYDSPNNRYIYASGEINDDVFDNIEFDTVFEIVGIDELPDVKQVIIDNFIPDLESLTGPDDEGYIAVKTSIETGEAKIGYWDKETHYGPDTYTTRTYMLI